MCCIFGHTPRLGFSSKWEIKTYQLRNYFGRLEERALCRTHVCKRCGVHYTERKEVDHATEIALKEIEK